MSRTQANPDLSVTLGSLELPNPILTASGTFGSGPEMARFCEIDRIGAVVMKTVTPEARIGNDPPRLWETPSGMLNAIGLANGGIDNFLEQALPETAAVCPRLIVNFAGHTLDEYVDLARRLDARDEPMALEMNVSCPNVKGGMDFATNPKETARLVAAVRKVMRRPLIVKLSPNVTDIVTIARAAADHGADILSLTNTFLGMAIDWRTRRPQLGNTMGGLSGPAIRPLSLRMVYQVAGAVDAPVIGIGGIVTADDVLEFIVAGAAAVQVGSATFRDPNTVASLPNDVSAKLAEAGIGSVRELTGTATPPGTATPGGR